MIAGVLEDTGMGNETGLGHRISSSQNSRLAGINILRFSLGL